MEILVLPTSIDVRMCDENGGGGGGGCSYLDPCPGLGDWIW